VAMAEACLIGEFLSEVGPRVAAAEAGPENGRPTEIEAEVEVEDEETGEVRTLKVVYELEGDGPDPEDDGCEKTETKEEVADDSDEDAVPGLMSDNTSQAGDEDDKHEAEEQIDKDEIWSVVDGPDKEGHMHSQDVALLMGRHPKHDPAMSGRVTVAGSDEWIVLGEPQEV